MDAQFMKNSWKLLGFDDDDDDEGKGIEARSEKRLTRLPILLFQLNAKRAGPGGVSPGTLKSQSFFRGQAPM